MSFRQQCWVGVAVLGGALACAQAETPAVIGERVPAPVIEDLQRRRAEFESPTAGSSFEDVDGENSSAFAEALKRAASEHAENAPALSPRMTDIVPLPDTRGRFVAALREAARVLETTAADLEDVAAYDEADELRGRAANLRLGARRALSSAEKCAVE